MPVTTQCSSSQHPILAILCSQICRANLSVARSLPQTSLPRCWSISQRLNKNWKSIKGTIPISFSISFNVSPEIITTTRESSILKAWTAGQDSANQVRPQRHLGTLKLWLYREVRNVMNETILFWNPNPDQCCWLSDLNRKMEAWTKWSVWELDAWRGQIGRERRVTI